MNEHDLETLRVNAESIMTIRRAVMSSMGLSYDGQRDLFAACGYPKVISSQDYYDRYSRGDIAKALVEAFPDACWQVDPEVWDTDDADEKSPFEEAWEQLLDETNLLAELKLLDVLSGIGRYGCLFLGYSDSADLSQPPKHGSKLLYATAFREDNAPISSTVGDVSNVRYGMPEYYQLNTDGGVAQDSRRSLPNVHWSRIIHVLDNRVDSKVFGQSRLHAVWNRLMNIDVILSGGAEGYWRAGFPGIMFSADKDARMTPDGKKDFNEQVQNYVHNLSRVIRAQGIDAKPLSSPLQSPLGILQCQLWMISATSRIPYRILTGAEQGEMASTKDQDNWNTRVSARRLRHCDPYILRATIDRLIEYGVLPAPKDGTYKTEWPSGREEKESEQIENNARRVDMTAAYLSGGVEQLIPRMNYMVDFLGMSVEEAEDLLKAADATAEEEAQRAAADLDEIRGAEDEQQQRGVNGGANMQTPQTPNAPPSRPSALHGLRAMWDKARSFLRGNNAEPVGIEKGDRVEVLMSDGTKVSGKVIGSDENGRAVLYKDGKTFALPEMLSQEPSRVTNNESVPGSSPSAVAVLRVERMHTHGGEGSGNFGHAGRPGERGGSAPSALSKTATYTKKNGWRTETGDPLPEHIAKLAPPPGWKKIWYTDDKDADLLMKGIDSKGRTQSRYSDSHKTRKAAAKFERTSDVVDKYPQIVETFKSEMEDDDASACAALVSVTGMRPGSKKDTGADVKGYGATTLLARHVKRDREGVFLEYVPGKKHGQTITMRVTDKDVGKMLWKRASARSEDERLFPVSDKKLRAKVRDVAGCMTKDLRTAVGTMTATGQMRKMSAPSTYKDYRAQVYEVATVVSEKLGNSPTVALAAYIDPAVFSVWRKPEWSKKK